jgi:hypothetical protein
MRRVSLCVCVESIEDSESMVENGLGVSVRQMRESGIYECLALKDSETRAWRMRLDHDMRLKQI